LSTIGDILQRQKALATQASSGQLGTAERSLLNQEFTNLRSEIDRIASVSNFNGTTLLAGATTVTSNKNSLQAYTGSNVTNVNNLIGDGFESIDFSNSYGNGAIKIDYDSTTRNMTVTRLSDGGSQTIQLASGAISAASPESYNFGNLGVSIKLNSQFDKTTSIDGRNTARANIAIANQAITNSAPLLGAAGATSITLTVSAQSFSGTGTNTFFSSQLGGATVAISGAVASAALGNITVGGKTFINTTGTTRDLSGAGATGTYTFSDGNGNTFSILATVVGTATGTFAGTGTFSTSVGTIESGGTAATEAILTRAVSSGDGVTTTAFDFGNVTNARLTSAAVSGGTATFSTVLNGVTFTSGAVTLNTVGTKTATFTGVGAANTQNTFTVQFNVINAFGTGDVAVIDMGDFGALVGSRSATTNTTSFDFKVGTGVTSNDSITVSLNSATTTALDINSSTVDSASNANAAITALNAAINTVSSRRADIGASQSRLEFANASIAVAIENTTAATSALLDVDVSSEITNFTSKQVLLQAGINLLSQANQQPSLLLRLLQ
jgi:flagellin-like hook-associated protein FlgL